MTSRWKPVVSSYVEYDASFGVYEMSDQRTIDARARIDNLIESIGNYIKKGRVYTEQDLCKIYYKVKKNEPVWISGDQYYPYRRNELIEMACDRIRPDDEDEWRE